MINSLAQSNLLLLTFIFGFGACTTIHSDAPAVDGNEQNPYPTLMSIGKNENGTKVHIIELNPKSLDITCSLRSDFSYYWCTLSGELKKKDLHFPARIEVTYHRAVDEQATILSKNLVKRMKNSNSVNVVTPLGFTVNQEAFSNLMFGLFSSTECMDLFYDYSLCPASAKFFDIFSRN